MNWDFINTFFFGATFAAVCMSFIRVGLSPYRRWYLMCRNELEKIDPANPVLHEIGARTSKREKWESQ